MLTFTHNYCPKILLLRDSRKVQKPFKNTKNQQNSAGSPDCIFEKGIIVTLLSFQILIHGTNFLISFQLILLPLLLYCTVFIGLLGTFFVYRRNKYELLKQQLCLFILAFYATNFCVKYNYIGKLQKCSSLDSQSKQNVAWQRTMGQSNQKCKVTSGWRRTNI